MKKTSNKGFSLVELIIVIAIMAILAGAIAPALIRYIDKSRKSNDVSSCKTIKTAVETAIGNEDIYEVLVSNGATTGTVIEVIPNQKTASLSGGGSGITDDALKITGCTIPSTSDLKAEDILAEIGTNIGEKTPKVKYKKELTAKATGLTSAIKPESFYAVISPKGTVYVGVGPKGASPTVTSKGVNGIVEIAPNVNKAYQ